MKKASAASDGKCTSRVVHEPEHEECGHDSFALKDLPDMVLAVIVRLLDSFPLVALRLLQSVKLSWASFVGISDVFAIRRVNVKLRDLAGRYNLAFRILQELENSCTLDLEQKGTPRLTSNIFGDHILSPI